MGAVWKANLGLLKKINSFLIYEMTDYHSKVTEILRKLCYYICVFPFHHYLRDREVYWWHVWQLPMKKKDTEMMSLSVELFFHKWFSSFYSTCFYWWCFSIKHGFTIYLYIIHRPSVGDNMNIFRNDTPSMLINQCEETNWHI